VGCPPGRYLTCPLQIFADNSLNLKGEMASFNARF